jgi:hypothetical protein
VCVCVCVCVCAIRLQTQSTVNRLRLSIDYTVSSRARDGRHREGNRTGRQFTKTKNV